MLAMRYIHREPVRESWWVYPIVLELDSVVYLASADDYSLSYLKDSHVEI
jgi:hypothetical protein